MIKINRTYIGLMILGIGFILLFFGSWQKDYLFGPALNYSSQDRAEFYMNLVNQGIPNFGQMKFTINLELFPNMKAIEVYDLCDIMIWSSWFFTVTGAFLIHNTIVETTKKIKYKLLYKQKSQKLIQSTEPSEDTGRGKFKNLGRGSG